MSENALTTTDDYTIMLTALEAVVEQEASQKSAFLKFKRGKWLVGSDNDKAPDQAYIALITRAKRGFIRWENNKPTRREMRFLHEPEVLRDDLGDSDQTLWPVGPIGSVDPWQYTHELALVAEDGGKLVYSTASWGGRQAIVDWLLTEYLRQARQAPGELPVVRLSGKQEKHQTYGIIEKPVFQVVGWAPDPDFGKPLPATAQTDEAPPTMARPSQIDDEIPF